MRLSPQELVGRRGVAVSTQHSYVLLILCIRMLLLSQVLLYLLFC